MENFNKIKQAISKLTEQEAKMLLTLLLIRTDQENEGEIIRTLQSIKQSLIEVSQNEQVIEHP